MFKDVNFMGASSALPFIVVIGLCVSFPLIVAWLFGALVRMMIMVNQFNDWVWTLIG